MPVRKTNGHAKILYSIKKHSPNLTSHIYHAYLIPCGSWQLPMVAAGEASPIIDDNIILSPEFQFQALQEKELLDNIH